MSDPELYHEKQKLQFCLVHTLNNILQRREFTSAQLDEICYSFNESRWFNPHRSWIGLGNYDVNILMAALQLHNLKTIWFDKRLTANKLNTDLITAIIVNIPSTSMIPFVRGHHWFPILSKDGKFYNLDSKLKKPALVENIKQFVQRYIDAADTEFMVVVPNETAEENVIHKE